MQSEIKSPLSLLTSKTQHLNSLASSPAFQDSFKFSLLCEPRYVAPSFLKFLLPLFSTSPEFIVIRCSLKSMRHEGLQHTFELTVSEFEELMAELLKARALLTSLSDTSLDECVVCFQNPPDVLLTCYHAFCAPCVAEIKKLRNSLCPYCRSEIAMEERARIRSSYVIVSPQDDQDEIHSDIHKTIDQCYAFMMTKHPLFAGYF